MLESLKYSESHNKYLFIYYPTLVDGSFNSNDHERDAGSPHHAQSHMSAYIIPHYYYLAGRSLDNNIRFEGVNAL